MITILFSLDKALQERPVWQPGLLIKFLVESLRILTTQPGLQFYSGNELNGKVPGRSGLYRQSAGFAIEPHGFPNAVNQSDFPSVVLYPGEIYQERTIYQFLVAQ